MKNIYDSHDAVWVDYLSKPCSSRRLIPSLLRGWTRGDIILAAFLSICLLIVGLTFVLPQHGWKQLDQAPVIDRGPVSWTDIETTIETPPVEVNGSQG